MNEYRLLTEEEIGILEENGCQAEDWTSVNVADGFNPAHVRNVSFYGDVFIGALDKYKEISAGFRKHCGISNATLRNVTIGDNCLIENIGGYINNYVIGEECYISNVNSIETTEEATYGQGNIIPVLNEMGDGNVIIFSGLSSQLAAIMVENSNDSAFMEAMEGMIGDYVETQMPDCGVIGDMVEITNVGDITNAWIGDLCEINGAFRVSDCTISSSPLSSVYIGSGVICESCIIREGSSVTDNAKIVNCFVDEACHIANGFTAENSLFFANSYMANGEACAAFCGPFSSSHHKSSLLIGTMLSFYNAGSGTNYSNHAYKMGPLHYGELARGSKTASGSHILLPANIGAFSVCLGKIATHPNLKSLPFSYIIGKDDKTVIVPGRNLCTVGLYRDVRKWPMRDLRVSDGQGSITNFDWLNPCTVGDILQGVNVLKQLRDERESSSQEVDYQGNTIKVSSLCKGIDDYDMALRLFMGEILKDHPAVLPETYVGKGDWKDMQGLLLPVSEEQRLISDVKDKTIETLDELVARFAEIHSNYKEYKYTWAYQLILDYYHIDSIGEADEDKIHRNYVEAKLNWIDNIRKDAQKEFALEDVSQDVFDDFIVQLDKELEL